MFGDGRRGIEPTNPCAGGTAGMHSGFRSSAEETEKPA